MKSPRTLVVVGGSSGIGYAILQNLSIDKNWNSINLSRTPPKGLPNIHHIKCDVCSDKEVGRAWEKIKKIHGAVHGLVYSTGITSPIKSLQNTKDGELAKIMDTNVNGAIRVCKYAYPLLRKEQGKVVLISSQSAKSPSKVSSLEYSISKSALNMLGLYLAREWLPDGIFVNVVMPGPTLTPMLKNTLKLKRFNGLKEKILGSAVDPNHIFSFIEYLLSDTNTSVTGSEIFLDQGARLK